MLSVIIPYRLTSSEEFFLDLWLKSCTELELIFVQDVEENKNNFSLEKLLSNYPGINSRHLSGKFNGPGASRNAGLEIATRDYVCFWDIDDIPNIENVKLLMSKMIFENADIGVGAFLVNEVNGESKQIIKSSLNLRHDLISLSLNPGLWRWIFKKSVLEGKRFPELKMAEDQVFLENVGVFNYKISYSSRVTYSYTRGLPSQLTGTSRFHGDIKKAIELISSHSARSSKKTTSFRHLILLRLRLTLIKSNLTRYFSD